MLDLRRAQADWEDDLLIPSGQQQPRRSNKIPAKKKEKTKATLIGRRAKGVMLKQRTTRKRSPDDQDGSHKEQAIQRTPETILDTRLHDAEEKGHFRCDSCTSWFRGSHHGEFLPWVRDMSFEDLMDGRQDGSVDPSWYCVECWGDCFRNERDWEGDTRKRLGLPPASRPSTSRDQRFHNKSGRWAYCDRRGSYMRTVEEGLANTSAAASSMAPGIRLRDRDAFAPRVSPRRSTGACCGRQGNGMPPSRAGHASRRCGRG